MKQQNYYLVDADRARALYFKLDDRYENVCHFHDSIEFLIPLKGEIQCSAENDTKILKKGDIFFADSYESHVYHTNKDNNLAIVLVISRNYLSDFFRNYPDFTFQHFMCDKEKNEIITEHLMSWFNKSNKTDLYNQGCINIFLSLLVESYPLIKKNENNSNALLKNLLVYIHEHYLEDISLSSVSNALGYTIEHCSKTLKKATNCNFRSYLNTLRLRRANELMCDKSLNMTASQILHQCGFTSPATFYRVKKQLGL